MNVILIPEPYIPTSYDISEYELFKMESNVRRMKHMIENGYYVNVYSEEEWQKFKKRNQNKDD